MRVLVCGSRGWTDRAKIAEYLHPLPLDAVIVHGGAKGADILAGSIARELGLREEVHPANWDRYGIRAGLLRNDKMLDSGIDKVLAFWNGKSSGTRHTISGAKRRNIECEVILGG